ncbi:NAD(P)H-binding protein [Micromonospora sp. KC606]|uniref:NAD(P)H-binding protein n=1 Tax=Micromonospora sp. KC606 TaxID=2530379 RepID=UPI001FB7FABD|nr:NAD(P)H-binding protein [Micromonospora sp. KC606]
MVLGATGKTGRRLVRTLRMAGRPVRAASRTGEVRFDWADEGSWAAVLEGASALYLIAPEDPTLARPFVQRAGAAGVRRIVALSGRGMDRIPAGFFEGMSATEQAVRESDVEWTIIRPNNFCQNFDEDHWHTAVRAGRLALPIGAVPEPFIDAQDIADVAAALLTTDGHHGQVYELSGPRAVTFGEAVATIAAAAGRPVRYEELTPQAYRSELLAEGVPADIAADLESMFANMRAGHIAEPVDGVRRLLGREPVDFDRYAARAAAAGAWR